MKVFKKHKTHDRLWCFYTRTYISFDEIVTNYGTNFLIIDHAGRDISAEEIANKKVGQLVNDYLNESKR